MGRGRRTIDQRVARATQLVRWLAEHDDRAFARLEVQIESAAKISRRSVKEIDE